MSTRFYAASFLISFSIIFSGCEGDEKNIIITPKNSAPIANAGDDQHVNKDVLVMLDGTKSSDDDGDGLIYSWLLLEKPNTSTATLNGSDTENPNFTADLDGQYKIQLTVNDGLIDSSVDEVIIISAPNVTVDSFTGSGALQGYITNNEALLPDITQTDGRYRAHLTDNSNNKTVHFHQDQGRLDAKLTNFPFEYIARNIGIGMVSDSQTAPAAVDTPYMFAGVQIHVTDLNDTNSSHIVVGHRGGTAFTLEGKNTLNGVSAVNDLGPNIAPEGRLDIRVVGNADQTLSIYWQLPNLSIGSQADTWIPYKDTGRLPETAPNYASSVYVGLITYAWNTETDFVGTCDSVTLYQY
ncbi:MAG: hypothetical protein HRU20_13140 [Pseudomonadales bacterium]|nr:hypothetical protein [Pseudomonadales bacterium]